VDLLTDALKYTGRKGGMETYWRRLDTALVAAACRLVREWNDDRELVPLIAYWWRTVSI